MLMVMVLTPAGQLQSALEAEKAALASTQIELGATKSQLVAMQEQSTALKADLSELKHKLEEAHKKEVLLAQVSQQCVVGPVVFNLPYSHPVSIGFLFGHSITPTHLTSAQVQAELAGRVAAQDELEQRVRVKEESVETMRGEMSALVGG